MTYALKLEPLASTVGVWAPSHLSSESDRSKGFAGLVAGACTSAREATA